MTFDSMIDRLKAQFDAPLSLIEGVTNDRHRRLASEAKWLHSQRQIALTVAGQQTYTLPAGLTHLADLKVAGDVYEWAPEADLWRINGSDNGHWFSVLDDDTNTTLLQLAPTPDETGLSITAIITLLPTDLSYGTGAVFVIPQDFHFYLHAGAKADLYEEVDERPDLAAIQEQRFEVGLKKLRARRASIVGPRVTQIRVEPWR